MRAALIENGFVAGYIVVDAFTDVWIDPKDSVLGDRWDGHSFSSPDSPPPVPESVPMRSARLALYGAGLLDQVQALIDAMPGTDGDLARIDWSTALTVERHSPLVLGLIPQLGKTDAEIDALFVAAAAIQ